MAKRKMQRCWRLQLPNGVAQIGHKPDITVDVEMTVNLQEFADSICLSRDGGVFVAIGDAQLVGELSPYILSVSTELVDGRLTEIHRWVSLLGGRVLQCRLVNKDVETAFNGLGRAIEAVLYLKFQTFYVGRSLLEESDFIKDLLALPQAMDRVDQLKNDIVERI